MPAGVQDVRPVFLHFVLFLFLEAYYAHACVGFHTLPYIVNRHVDTRSDRRDEGVLARRAIRRLPRAADRRARRARRHRLPEPPYEPTPIPSITPKQQRKHKHSRRCQREPTRHRLAVHRGARTRRAPATPSTRPVASATLFHHLRFRFRVGGGAPASFEHAPSGATRALLPRVGRKGTCRA